MKSGTHVYGGCDVSKPLALENLGQSRILHLRGEEYRARKLFLHSSKPRQRVRVEVAFVKEETVVDGTRHVGRRGYVGSCRHRGHVGCQIDLDGDGSNGDRGRAQNGRMQRILLGASGEVEQNGAVLKRLAGVCLAVIDIGERYDN